MWWPCSIVFGFQGQVLSLCWVPCLSSGSKAECVHLSLYQQSHLTSINRHTHACMHTHTHTKYEKELQQTIAHELCDDAHGSFLGDHPVQLNQVFVAQLSEKQHHKKTTPVTCYHTRYPSGFTDTLYQVTSGQITYSQLPGHLRMNHIFTVILYQVISRQITHSPVTLYQVTSGWITHSQLFYTRLTQKSPNHKWNAVPQF